MPVSQRGFAIFFLCILLFLPSSGLETPVIIWEGNYGGGHEENARSIQETPDGGYILAGSSCSQDGQVSFTGLEKKDFCEDFWIVKLDPLGNLQWERSLGGSHIDIAHSIDTTSDNGCIVAGETWSHDGNVTGFHGASDYWVVRLDSNGDLLWERAYGGKSTDQLVNIQETRDKGYLVMGYSESSSGDVSPDHPPGAIWMIKLDQAGNLTWQKSVSGLLGRINDIKVTPDSGYVIVGEYLYPCTSPVRCPPSDSWICKLDENGTILWQKTIGGSDSEAAYHVRETPDKGFLAFGWTWPVYDNWTLKKIGSEYAWFTKLNESGDPVWQTPLENNELHHSNLVLLGTEDGGYVVAAPKSPGGFKSWTRGMEADMDVIRLDPKGEIVWEILLDKGKWTDPWSIITTSDNCIAIAGFSINWDDTVPGHHGVSDFYAAKLGILKPLPDSKRLPRDLNEDGTYEDLNGDGKVTIEDLFMFYRKMGWISRNEPIPCFDFNKDQKLSVLDGFPFFSL